MTPGKTSFPAGGGRALFVFFIAFLVDPGFVRAQGANCQAGSGPFAGFATSEEFNAAAAATPNVCAFHPSVHAAVGTKLRHVLLYDWSAGGHSKTHTQRHLYRLSRRHGFRLDRSQDSTYITAATLQDVDLVVINNSENDPFQNPTSLTAMRNFIEVQGKSMLLIHAAAAFIPCPQEDLESPDCRWIFRAIRTQFWRNMNHVATQRVRIYADSVQAGEIPPNAAVFNAGVYGSRPPNVPAALPHGRVNPETRNIFEHLPSDQTAQQHSWDGLWDEWYAYQNHPRLEGARVLDNVTYGPVNQLLSLDETSVPPVGTSPGPGGCASDCRMGDRPISWTRKMGNGLAAYNTAGHGDVYVRTRVVAGDTIRDSLVEKYTWRLMKYLARDFVGCMAPSDANYNPQATVLSLTPSDPACPCQQSANCAVGLRGNKGGAAARASFTVRAGVLRVTLPEPGLHRIRVTDAAGREIRAAEARGGGSPATLSGLRRGTYVVTVRGPRGAVHSERVRVP